MEIKSQKNHFEALFDLPNASLCTLEQLIFTKKMEQNSNNRYGW